MFVYLPNEYIHYKSVSLEAHKDSTQLKALSTTTTIASFKSKITGQSSNYLFWDCTNSDSSDPRNDIFELILTRLPVRLWVALLRACQYTASGCMS